MDFNIIIVLNLNDILFNIAIFLCLCQENNIFVRNQLYFILHDVY